MAERPRRAQLDSVPEAAAQARRAISGWLAGTVDQPMLEDAKLLVSELVTNAVRHPRTPGSIQVDVALDGRGLRVEVTDPGSGFTKPRVDAPPLDAVGGRGLLIVDRLASRWGVASGNPTRVWFELDR